MSRKRERREARRNKANESFTIRGRRDAQGRLLEYSWTGSCEPDISALFK